MMAPAWIGGVLMMVAPAIQSGGARPFAGTSCAAGPSAVLSPASWSLIAKEEDVCMDTKHELCSACRERMSFGLQY
jgi:hypothetical protein